MEYIEWSKIYAYGLVLGSIVTIPIILFLVLLGLDKTLPYHIWILLFGAIVVLFVILAWYFLEKRK